MLDGIVYDKPMLVALFIRMHIILIQPFEPAPLSLEPQEKARCHPLGVMFPGR